MQKSQAVAINQRSAGFSLVELLIAMTAMLVILGALYHVFSSQSKISNEEQDALRVQMNVRVAVERLSFAFQSAGFGCQLSFLQRESMSGKGPDEEQYSISSAVFDIENKDPNGDPSISDTVILTYGFKKVAEVEADADSNDVDLKNEGTPAISEEAEFQDYISFFPNMSSDTFYQVQSRTTDSINLDQDVQVSADDQVFMVAPVRIKLQDGKLYLQNFVYSDKDNPEQYWTVAQGIQDLQIQYSTDGETFVDEPGNPLAVQKVRFWVLGRSSREHPGHNDQKTYTLAGKTLGPFNDGHRRMLGYAEVNLRNAR